MKRAIIYARISRDLDGSGSIEQQEAACRAWAEARGLAVAVVHADRGLSGGSPDRPGLWEAINALRRGDTLLAAKPDRLSRSVFLSCVIERRVAESGATIATVSAGEADDTPENALMRQILAAFSEYERKLIGARTSAAMRAHQRAGRAMSHHPPRGFRRVGDRLEPDEREQAMIALAAAKRGEGLTFTQVAEELRAQGYTGRGGSPLTGAKVSRILNRRG